MIERIHADLFFQEIYLLNEVNVKIKLTRSRYTFLLIGVVQHKVTIEQAILYVQKVKLSSAMFLAHANALEITSARYLVRCIICKSVTIRRRDARETVFRTTAEQNHHRDGAKQCTIRTTFSIST